MAGVFISYLREDFDRIQPIADYLRARGAEVWLDRESLLPGTRWKQQIRSAIAQGDFFVACFSAAYNARSKSYLNEELTLAIEELRLRPASRPWFIPVLLDDCDLPDRSIGAGETFADIQAIRLFDGWEEGIRRLASTICNQQREEAKLGVLLAARRLRKRQGAFGYQTSLEDVRSLEKECDDLQATYHRRRADLLANYGVDYHPLKDM